MSVGRAPGDMEGAGAGANWRTMMATFVTRLERDHEALLEALRERLTEAEARSRTLEERMAALEARMAGQAGVAPQAGDVEARLSALERAGRSDAAVADALRALETRLALLEETVRRRPEPAQGQAMPGSAAAPPVAEGGRDAPPAGAAPPLGVGRGGGPSQGGASGPARAPWQEAAEAMLRRESELVARAERGDTPRDIAAALGRGVGEVELVLRLAERAGHEAFAGTRNVRGGM